MSNLWRLKFHIGFDENSISWPAILKAEFCLSPCDFFDRPDPSGAKVCISRESTQFEILPYEATILIKHTGTADPLHERLNFDKGHISIKGSKAILETEVENLGAAAAFIDWSKVMLSQFLSVKLGVFSDMRLIEGAIAGIPFVISSPGISYCALVTMADPAERSVLISAAVNMVSVSSPSYPRFVISCFYYQHALRLLSPHEVSFPQFTAVPEIMLNLEKCIQSLFPSASRDALGKKIQELGFSEEQVKSQLLSILMVRNDFDIGHSSSGVSSIEDLSLLREFSNRSVINVRALLLAVAEKIRTNENFLSPLSQKMDKQSLKTLGHLKNNLSQPSLEPQPSTQAFIQARTNY
jgi:hypothetical protein